jgi:hypothetical protein
MRKINKFSIIILTSLLFLGVFGTARALTMQEIITGQNGGQVLGEATIARVQTVGKACNTTTPCTVNISATKAGDELMVGTFDMESDYDSPTCGTLTAAGATFQTAYCFGNFDRHRAMNLQYAENVPAGITSVTVTYPTAILEAAIIVSEYSGLAVSNSLDVKPTVTDLIFNTSYTSTAVSPASGQNELMIGLETNDQTSPGFTGTNDWAVEASQHSDWTMALSDNIVAGTAGSYSNSGTISAGSWVRVWAPATFKAAGSAPPPSDTDPPSVPSNLSATAISSSQINLSWNSSTDNVGVTGYKIFRSGAQIGTSAAANYFDSGLSAAANYIYTVSAYDAADNNSAQSITASATTQSVSAGRTFYIAANGSDSNSGTSKATPWLHAPGMPNCSAACAAVAPKSGDSFILQGGDTWHFGDTGAIPYTGGTWTWKWSGTNGGRIYVGVDQTWYSGSSWARPIMNGDNPTSTSGVASCSYPNQTFLKSYPQGYVTIDNFEFTGLCESGIVAYGTGVYIFWGGSYLNNSAPTYDIVQNVYIHGWTHVTFSCTLVNGLPSGNCDGAGGIKGTTDHTGGGGDQLIGVVCDGWDTDGASFDCVYGNGYDIHDSIFRYNANAVVVNNAHAFHDNLIEYIRSDADAVAHGNGAEFNVEWGGVNVVYNNVFRHLWQSGIPCGDVTMWMAPQITDYAFNNMVYDIPCTANYWNISNGLTGVSGWTANVFNNTFVATAGAFGGPFAGSVSGATVNFFNNHCILTNGGTVANCSSPHNGLGTENYSTNIVQTPSVAASQGYAPSEGYVYSPDSADGSTVGSGTNVLSYCNDLATAGLAEAAAACQSDTGYACVYNPLDHTVSCPAKALIVRPSTGPWDIGAYQYNSGGTTDITPPAAPTGIVVN